MRRVKVPPTRVGSSRRARMAGSMRRGSIPRKVSVAAFDPAVVGPKQCQRGKCNQHHRALVAPVKGLVGYRRELHTPPSRA